MVILLEPSLDAMVGGGEDDLDCTVSKSRFF